MDSYKNRLIVLLITLFFIFTTDNSAEDNFRYVKNEAYGLGETLVYNIGYGGITAGKGFIRVAPKVKVISNRNCYVVQFGAYSLKSLEWIYKVEDEYTSYIDINGIFPWGFKQKIRENKYKYDFWARFNQYKNTVKTKDWIYQTEPYMHDVISAFMHVRTMDLRSLKNGSTIHLKNFWKDSTYSLDVNIIKRETIKVPAGKFKCIVIEPIIAGGDLFKHDETIKIWLTDDDRKIPVKVGTKVLFGYVGAELKRYSGVRGKIDAKIK